MSKKIESVGGELTLPTYTDNVDIEIISADLSMLAQSAGKRNYKTNNNGEPIFSSSETFNDYTNNIASGAYSHAEGSSTNAAADCSHASGKGTIIETTAGTSIGKYNLTTTNTLFVVGNGSSDANRSDALLVSENGNIKIGGLLESSKTNVYYPYSEVKSMGNLTTPMYLENGVFKLCNSFYEASNKKEQTGGETDADGNTDFLTDQATFGKKAMMTDNSYYIGTGYPSSDGAKKNTGTTYKFCEKTVVHPQGRSYDNALVLVWGMDPYVVNPCSFLITGIQDKTKTIPVAAAHDPTLYKDTTLGFLGVPIFTAPGGSGTAPNELEKIKDSDNKIWLKPKYPGRLSRDILDNGNIVFRLQQTVDNAYGGQVYLKLVWLE